jgi:predicted transcriptional regulator
MRYPAAIYDGSAPKKGSTIKLRLGNGTLYAGEVYDATEAEGQVLVEFVDGIHCIAE